MINREKAMEDDLLMSRGTWYTMSKEAIVRWTQAMRHDKMPTEQSLYRRCIPGHDAKSECIVLSWRGRSGKARWQILLCFGTVSRLKWYPSLLRQKKVSGLYDCEYTVVLRPPGRRNKVYGVRRGKQKCIVHITGSSMNYIEAS